jgi:phosphohistidine phosphatase
VDVVVVRHAVAMDRDEALKSGMLDRDRPLTDKGESRMRKAARGLAECVPEVSIIITSPLRRAVETGKILQRQFKGTKLSETDALLPEAAPEELAQLLAEQSNGSPPVVVGHEPHLSSWLSWCLAGDTTIALELAKGGAYMLRFEAAPGPKLGRLLWLVTPAVLRRL